jgi:hypothetical protein
MYSGIMYGGQLPYGGLGDAAQDEITKVLTQLHGTAASLGDSRQRYEATHDPRYLQSVKAMLPYFQSLMTRLQQLYAMQGSGEMPSQFMLVLSDTGQWLQDRVQETVEGATGTLAALPKVAGALGNPLVLLAIGVGVFMFFGGGKLLRKG